MVRNGFEDLRNVLKDLDEYICYNRSNSLNVFTSGTLINVALPSNSNIVSLWFYYLYLKGYVSNGFPLFKVYYEGSTTFVAGDAQIKSYMEQYIENRNPDDERQLFIFNGSPQMFQMFDEEKSFEFGNWSYEVDDVVSNYLAIKGFLNNVKFVSVKSIDTDKITKHILIVDHHTEFDGYWSKIILKVLSASVRWAKPYLVQPYSEIETNFLSKISEAICKDNFPTMDAKDEIYSELADLIMSAFDITVVRKEKLRSFYSITTDRKLDSLSSEIDNLERNINACIEDMRHYINVKNEKTHQRAYLKIKRAEGVDESFNEFIDMLYNNCLDIRVSNTVVEFFHKSFLSYVNGESYIDDILHSSAIHWDDRIKTLLKALFVDKIVDIRMVSRYYIDFSNNSVNSCIREYMDDYGLLPTELENCMLNPHHHEYGCLGENRELAQQDAANGNYYDALLRLTYITGSINLEEEPTFDRFRAYLRNCFSGVNEYLKCFIFKCDEDKEENYLTANEVLSRLTKEGYCEAD